MGSDISLSKAVRANLLSLQNTAEMMNKTQNRLATGNKVNSALDNPSNFFTASALNSRAADMSNLLDAMASGIKVIEAANNGITALTKNLESMQSTLRQARQDKSFQTQSFNVGDDSIIRLSGGQFGNGVSEISLAQATQEGKKAEISTAAANYLGPRSTDASATGAGARSVISGLAGISNGDQLSVAGVNVTITDATDAESIAADIQAALDDDSTTATKYTVSAGTGDNAGKVIIESVSTSAPAAEVVFGTGTQAATKGSTSFNYSAITAEIKVGDETIATGTSFDTFVANLRSKAEAGGYTVEADTDTQQITLTSTEWGGAAPVIDGIPQGADAVGTEAETEFQLTTYNDGPGGVGGNDLLSSTQTLSVAGASGPIELTAGMTAAQVQAELEADANINDLYTVAVAADFTVTLTERTVTGNAAPTVTSSKGDAAATPATMTAAGGTTDFTDDGEVAALDGIEITFTTDDGVTHSYQFNAVDDAATQLAALSDNGYTVVANGAGGIDIARADGKNFTIEVTGGANAFGLPSPTFTTNDGVEAGLVGGNAAVAATDGTITTPAVDGFTETPPQAGVSVEAVAAEKHTFTISYDGKTAEISIGGVKGGIGSEVNALNIKNWQDATVASIKQQLDAEGITGVEAVFDETTGAMSLVAKTAEAKTLAISGDDAVALFGTNGVSTGIAEKSELNATKTVDKFVELINREHGGQVRASNDNGKLRIENLSTQELNIGVDLSGNDAFTPIKVEGNSVRANLSKQFNELRDQLDKLADDASFNGINLLRGDKLKITFNESGTSSIDIQAKDKDGNVRGINASNLNIDTLVAEDLDTDEAIDAFLGKLSSALSELRSQASSFGSNLSSVENRQSFTKNMINTLETGAANLTLADTNEEAANLLALQTRQQLSSSALSMASQQDQAVLQLLR